MPWHDLYNLPQLTRWDQRRPLKSVVEPRVDGGYIIQTRSPIVALLGLQNRARQCNVLQKRIARS